jgi:hypothetical protein
MWRSFGRRNGLRPVYKLWIGEAGSSQSLVSPQVGEINDHALQNGILSLEDLSRRGR